MNNQQKTKQQAQQVKPISHSDIHDELQVILQITEALASVGVNNSLQTVTGSEVTTIMEIISDRISPLMDKVMPEQTRNNKVEVVRS